MKVVPECKALNLLKLKRIVNLSLSRALQNKQTRMGIYSLKFKN